MGTGYGFWGCKGLMQGTGTDSGGKTSMAAGGATRRPDKGLLTIGLFKLVEAAFFLLVGVGAIHFIHHDLGDAATRLATRLRMDPDGRVVTWVLDHVDDFTGRRLRQIGVATIFYAGLRVTEGVGLVLQKAWAEYLTLGATASFLPWEVYEFIRRPHWTRVCLLVINLAVLVYLMWWVERRRQLGRVGLVGQGD